MKSLLWLVLSAALAANVFLSLAVEESGLQIALSVAAGVTAIASGVGLWMLRDPHES
ncbi:hypothetical protein [Streptomyces sp. SID14515]|uniref:hypothetical protein n=1 Tax=Streptomyces sp. SID14515 TaxID=2706074 RepID=UPI0019415156|nr:hypothetical protein [Streptomyces sp. SID14515]